MNLLLLDNLSDVSFLQSISVQNWFYLFFAVIIITFLVVDLGLFQKEAHVITFKSALSQSIFWVFVSFVFAGLLYYFYVDTDPLIHHHGNDPAQNRHDTAIEFISAYLMEKALSVDNIFVFILILNFFKVEKKYYHTILFYGILGAIIFRGIFIYVGSALIHEFHFILYIFGGLLVLTGTKMLFSDKETNFKPEENLVYKLFRKYFRFTSENFPGKFIVKINSKTFFTTSFMVIALIETTDIVFALDSIPACFAISQNEFVVYTSNIFAVMGLRAMFFLLIGVIDRFRYLQHGISLILIFIGVKMLLEIFNLVVPVSYSLWAILFVLTISIVLSWLISEKEKNETPPK